MNNNDIVIRLRYALAISNADMLKIFKLGGLELTNEKLVKILKRQDKETPRDQNLTMEELERFMNGLIISQRGIKKDANGQTLEPTFDMKKEDDINNVVLKKLKIAMQYTSEDYQSFFKSAGIEVSNAELSAVLRRPDHRNYRPAGNRYLRNILKGMALEYRKEQ
ncbi:DUF1456 family protein [Weissella koreensis]|uniref:DUF1456 family protein n=1 Tax=Weissella koreensis TaxID=165096 RepID=A0A7H1MMU7_9LACO|nr:DUF1456 family protein [Weissella koreensis]AVH75580.1 DUF1456 domain-containing protein [Weissella koreensis]MCZ9311635.1 DUF1456 family protein [Weissella koreensis]QGN20801.1 DUF1456 family protein [Weissella koreensis]QNT64783.1 DUF1456 family protein [Weissella koreensis]